MFCLKNWLIDSTPITLVPYLAMAYQTRDRTNNEDKGQIALLHHLATGPNLLKAMSKLVALSRTHMTPEPSSQTQRPFFIHLFNRILSVLPLTGPNICAHSHIAVKGNAKVWQMFLTSGIVRVFDS